MVFETFEHTADLGLRIMAPNAESLFAEAARGLFSIIVSDLDAVRLARAYPFELQGEATDLLLFDWLSELLYVYETRHLLLAKFEVTLTDGSLRATAWGEPVDRSRHTLDHEVKAITYHGLKLEHCGEQWMAEVIVDI
jgi:SHS2 domain-containing protein